MSHDNHSTKRDKSSEGDPLFTSLHLDNFIPAELALAVMLALAPNRIKGRCFRPQTLPQLMREVRHRLAKDPIMAEIAACYDRQPTEPSLLLRCQISAWAYIFGLTVGTLCQALEDDDHRPLRNTLGVRLSSGRRLRVEDSGRRLGLYPGGTFTG